MKIHSPILLALSFALAAALPAGAQLEPDSEPTGLGPLGGNAISVVVHPNDPDEILIIRYTEGVFRSTDGGDTFELAPYGTGYTIGLGVDAIVDLTRDPQDADTLWARQGPNLLKSTDFGANWTTLPLVVDYSSLKSFAVAPSGNGILALDAFNLYHSPDGGTTWNNVFNVVPFSGGLIDEVAYAASDATRAYVAVSGAGHGIYRSDDGGLTWAHAHSFPSSPDCLIVSATDADRLFVGTNFDGLFVSADGAASFGPITDPDTEGNANWLYQEPNGTLWYSMLDSLAFSTNGGSSWQPAIGGWPENTPVTSALAVDSNGKRYLGAEGGGLYDKSGGGLYSMPAGAPTTWTHIGFRSWEVRDVAIAGPGGIRMAGVAAGVFAGEQGETLTPTSWVADFGRDTRSIAVDADDSSRWIVGGRGYFFDHPTVVELTGDGDYFALAWERIDEPGSVSTLLYSHHDSNRMVAGISLASPANPPILYSIDGGSTWFESTGANGHDPVDISLDPHTAGNAIMVSVDNWWAVSGNYGQDWSPLISEWSNSGPAVLVAYDLHQPNVIYRGETGGGLWRSDDAASTWTPLGVTLHEHSTLLQHPEFPNLMWVTDAAGRVLVSTDSGDSWQTALDLPLGTNGADMALDTADGSLLIGTTSASTWELPNAAPAVNLGAGTAGTGGVVPSLFLSSGLAQVGSADFSIAGSGFRGGTTVFLAYGLSGVNVPAFGGTFYVGNLLNVFAFPVGGTPGVGGAGSFDFPFPLPMDPLLVGFSIYVQCGAIDLAVVNIDHIALSNGLKMTFHN